MKPLRFTSVNEEDVKDYEPVGSSIKFDSQDDALERIIKLKAKVLRSDIEHHRNKNKENSHEDEQEVVPLKADDAVREEVALQPKPKFEEIGGFDDLPKLKPIDDELAKEEEQEEPVKIDKFDAFSAPAELESKRQELNENLQAINEALNEIDALDEIPEQIDEIDEEAIFVAWKEPQIEKDTQEIGEFDKESEKSAEPVEETVAKEQTPNEKDQLLDFLRDEFSSVELEEDEPDNGDKFDVSQSDQDKFDTEDDEDFQSKFDSIKNEFDIAKNEINSGQTQSNLSADFWDVPQSKELEDKDFLKIDEHADLSEPEEQILEPNLRQTQEETSKGVEQVQTINDTQENRINTVKEPEARPVRRRDRAALLAELGLTMEEEAFGMSIRPPMPQDDDESEKRAAMKAVLDGYLMKLIELGGSDLHVKSDRVVRGRFNGEMVVMGDTVLDYDRSILIAKEILGANYYSLMKRKSVDFTYRLNDDYRFRSNVFLQMDGISFVFRTITTKIPTMSELLLPPVIEKLCDKVNRGIILVTGPTGSGKTTTLASMINYLNHTKNYHIVTIEDQNEFINTDDKSQINHRVFGQDVDR